MNKAAVLRAAINAYVLNHGGASGTNPPTLSSLVTTDGVACTTDNTAAHSTYLTLQGWCGPYIDQIFTQALNDYETDGWGTLFQYNNSTAVIKSCGPNRTCGDSDDISFSP